MSKQKPLHVRGASFWYNSGHYMKPNPNNSLLRVLILQKYHILLLKLIYFTNLGFPEIRGFPVLNHHLV